MSLPIPKEGNTNKWLALISIGIGVFMATLDTSIVNISLPTLVEELNTDFATVQWVVISYVLVLSSLLLSAGRLGDMYDKKKLYMLGLGLFSVSSLLCGLAPGVHWLIAFRAIQGLGATMTQALGTAMITEVFPPNERGRALGIMGSIVSIGIAIGPPIGGLLIGAAGWRSVFLVNVPIGVIALIMLARYLPRSLPTGGHQRFDYIGALVLFLTLGVYAMAMTLGQNLGFTSQIVLWMFGGAIAGLTLFVMIERRVPQPMVDFQLFHNLFFTLSLLMAFLVFNVLACSLVLPFFLELVKGYSPQMVGFLLMSMPVVMGVTAPVAGMLSDRFGSRGISLLGLIVIVIGALSMSSVHEDITPLGFILRMMPFGLGMGLFQSPNNSAVMGSVPRERLGIASGFLSLSRSLGNASGLPLMGAVFAAQVQASAMISEKLDITKVPPSALVAGVDGTYRLAAYIVLGATLLAVLAFVADARLRKNAVVNRVGPGEL